MQLPQATSAKQGQETGRTIAPLLVEHSPSTNMKKCQDLAPSHQGQNSSMNEGTMDCCGSFSFPSHEVHWAQYRCAHVRDEFPSMTSPW
eukprot:1849172-Amphidinium_carterae.1